MAAIDKHAMRPSGAVRHGEQRALTMVNVEDLVGVRCVSGRS